MAQASRGLALVATCALLVHLWLTEDVHGDGALAGASAPGDVLIGGIFPVHEGVEERNLSFAPHLQACVSLDESALVRALALIHSVEEVNSSPPLRDANLTLGYDIMDSCSDVSTALRVAATFARQHFCHHNGSSKGHANDANKASCVRSVMVVVGAAHSELSIAVARQLTLSMIPQISYSSTAVILSDKSRFPSFLRTIPNDQYQTAAMARFLSSYGWNWVGIVVADSDYGRSALDHFGSQAPSVGICVAFKSVMPRLVSRSTLRTIAKTILANPKVQVIVSFAKASTMKLLFQELHHQTTKTGCRLDTMRRVWVASDSWSSASTVTGGLSLEDIGHVVGFAFKSENISAFSKYLDRLEAAERSLPSENRFLKALYAHMKQNGVSGTEDVIAEAFQTLRKHISPDRILSVHMAVSAIGQAMVSLCQSRDCRTPGAVQPWEVLPSLWMEEFSLGGRSYRFDSNGDINLGYDVVMWMWEGRGVRLSDAVAEYHPHNHSFTYTRHPGVTLLHRLHSVVSRCSSPCEPGQFKKTAEGQHTCCYECANCTENYYSDTADMTECLSCNSSTEWSPEGSSSCRPKALLWFSWQDGFAVVLLVLSALGMLLVLLVSALFLHWRDTPVVRASGGPLSQAVLFSLLVSYVSAVLFVGRPSDLQCKVRQVLYGISFTVCVSCILVKTVQILLAFQFNPRLQALLRRLYRPYLIVGVCVGLQAVTCTCWLLLSSPHYSISNGATTLLEACDEGSYEAFGVMLGYIALLALVCFVCAFKGRKLPQQYNEGRFITFSMLLYLISWLLFIPVYVTTSGVYLPAVEMVVILISNYGILGCHFLPKCYIILLKKERNTLSAFRKDLYEYSSRPHAAQQTAVTAVTVAAAVTAIKEHCGGHCLALDNMTWQRRRRSVSI